MQKRLFIGISVIAFAQGAFALSMNGNVQVYQAEKTDMSQKDTKNSKMAINSLESKAGSISVDVQHASGDKLSMSQKDSKNSSMAVNNAIVRKNTLVVQNAKYKKVSMSQKGGKNNDMAINKIVVNK